MSTRNLRRTLAVLACAAALALLPAVTQAAPAAATRGPEGGYEATSSLFSWLWSFFQNAWGAEGASLDPNGVRPTGAPEGGSLDPDGIAVAPGDEGPSLDPDGLAAPGDEGGSLDPNG